MTSLVEISLPWAPRELSPNARIHWARKAPIIANYRHACAWSTKRDVSKSAINELIAAVHSGSVLHLFVEFFPPDKRRRDDDNLTGAFKHGRDGIASALCIDDRHFRMHPLIMEETVKAGLVRVRIKAHDKDFRYGL